MICRLTSVPRKNANSVRLFFSPCAFQDIAQATRSRGKARLGESFGSLKFVFETPTFIIDHPDASVNQFGELPCVSALRIASIGQSVGGSDLARSEMEKSLIQ